MTDTSPTLDVLQAVLSGQTDIIRSQAALLAAIRDMRTTLLESVGQRAKPTAADLTARMARAIDAHWAYASQALTFRDLGRRHTRALAHLGLTVSDACRPLVGHGYTVLVSSTGARSIHPTQEESSHDQVQS